MGHWIVRASLPFGPLSNAPIPIPSKLFQKRSYSYYTHLATTTTTTTATTTTNITVLHIRRGCSSRRVKTRIQQGAFMRLCVCSRGLPVTRSEQGGVSKRESKSFAATGELHSYPGTNEAASLSKAVVFLWHPTALPGDSCCEVRPFFRSAVLWRPSFFSLRFRLRGKPGVRLYIVRHVWIRAKLHFACSEHSKSLSWLF